MSDLWGETGEFLIFLLWHIVQVRNLVPKLFMVRVQPLWQSGFTDVSCDPDTLLSKDKAAIVWPLRCQISGFRKCFSPQYTCVPSSPPSAATPTTHRAELWFSLYFQPTDKNSLSFSNTRSILRSVNLSWLTSAGPPWGWNFREEEEMEQAEEEKWPSS